MNVEILEDRARVEPVEKLLVAVEKNVAEVLQWFRRVVHRRSLSRG